MTEEKDQEQTVIISTRITLSQLKELQAHFPGKSTYAVVHAAVIYFLNEKRRKANAEAELYNLAIKRVGQHRKKQEELMPLLNKVGAPTESQRKVLLKDLLQELKVDENEEAALEWWAENEVGKVLKGELDEDTIIKVRAKVKLMRMQRRP